MFDLPVTKRAHFAGVLLATTKALVIILVYFGHSLSSQAFWPGPKEEAPPVYADEWGPGFQADDATEALQGAIDSGAPDIVVRNMGGDWIVRPIHLNSSFQSITFEPGVRVLAKSGAFHGVNDALFSTAGEDGVEPIGSHHIRLEGTDVTFRMNQEDYTGES